MEENEQLGRKRNMGLGSLHARNVEEFWQLAFEGLCDSFWSMVTAEYICIYAGGNAAKTVLVEQQKQWWSSGLGRNM